MEGEKSPSGAAATLTKLTSKNPTESGKEVPKLPPLIVEFRNYFGELSAFMEPHAYHIGLHQSLAEMCEQFYFSKLSQSIMGKAQEKLSVQVCQAVLFNLLLPDFIPQFREDMVLSCLQQLPLYFLLDAVLSSSVREKVREQISSWCMFPDSSSDPFGTPGREGNTPKSGDGNGVNGEPYNWSSHGPPSSFGFGSFGREYQSGSYGPSNDTAFSSYPINSHNLRSSSAVNNSTNTNPSCNNNDSSVPHQKSVSTSANRLSSGYIEDSRRDNRQKAEVPKNTSSRVIAGQNPLHRRSAHPTAPPPLPPPSHSASMLNASFDRSSRGGSSSGVGKGISNEEDYERNSRYHSRGSYRMEEHPRGGAIASHYHHSTPPSNHHLTASHSSSSTSDNSSRGGFRGGGRGNYNSSSFSSSHQSYDSGPFLGGKGNRADAGRSRGVSNRDAHLDGSSSRNAVDALGGGSAGRLSSNSRGGDRCKRAGDEGVTENDVNSSGSCYRSEPYVAPTPFQSPSPLPVENASTPRVAGEVSQFQPPPPRHLLSSSPSSFSSFVDPSTQHSFHSFRHHTNSASTPGGYNELQQNEGGTPHHQHQHSSPRSNEVPQRPAMRGAGRFPLPAFHKRPSEGTPIRSHPSSVSSSSMPSVPPSSGSLGVAGQYEQSTCLIPSPDRSSSTSHASPPVSFHNTTSLSSENISPTSLPLPGGSSVQFSSQGKTGDSYAPPSLDAGFHGSAPLRVSSRPAPNSPFVGMTPGGEGKAYHPQHQLLVEEESQVVVTPLPLYQKKGRANRDGNGDAGATNEIPLGGEIGSAVHCTTSSSLHSFRSSSDVEASLSSILTAGSNAPSKPGDEKGPFSTQSSGFTSSSIHLAPYPHHHHHIFDSRMIGKPLLQKREGGTLSAAAQPQVPCRTELSRKSAPTPLLCSSTSPPPSSNEVKQPPSNSTAVVAPFFHHPHHHHHHHHHFIPLPSQSGVSQATSTLSMNSLSHLEGVPSTGGHSSLLSSSPSLVVPHHTHHMLHHIHHLSPPTQEQREGTPLSGSAAPLSPAPFLHPHFHHNIFSLSSSNGNSQVKVPPHLASDQKTNVTPPLESSESFLQQPTDGSGKTLVHPSKLVWQGSPLPSSVSSFSSAPPKKREDAGHPPLSSSYPSAAVLSPSPGIPLPPPSSSQAPPPPLSFHSLASSRSASQTGSAANYHANGDPQPSSVHPTPSMAEGEKVAKEDDAGGVRISPAQLQSDPYSTTNARSPAPHYAEYHHLASSNESGSVDEAGSDSWSNPKMRTGGANCSRVAQEENFRLQENNEHRAMDALEARPTGLLEGIQHPHSMPPHHGFSGNRGASGSTAMFSKAGFRGGRGGRGTNAGYARNGLGRGAGSHASSIPPSSLPVQSLSSCNSVDSYSLQSPSTQTGKPEDSCSSFHSDEKKTSKAEIQGDGESRSYSTTFSNPPRFNEEEEKQEKQERKMSVNNSGRGGRRGSSRLQNSRGRGRGSFGFKNYRGHEESSEKPCIFHSQGQCKFGTSCRNSHRVED